MANRYCNLVGSNKIKDEYQKINTGFYEVQTDIDAKASTTSLNNHINNKSNPHTVTKAQVGLGNVLNVEQAGKTEFNNHINNKSNPHTVTKAQVGLGNVLNVEQATIEQFNQFTTSVTNKLNSIQSQIDDYGATMSQILVRLDILEGKEFIPDFGFLDEAVDEILDYGLITEVVDDYEELGYIA